MGCPKDRARSTINRPRSRGRSRSGGDDSWRHAEHRLGSPTEAEDAVSSAFAHAYEHRQRYDRERASLGTWLAAIVAGVIVVARAPLDQSPKLGAYRPSVMERVSAGGATRPE